MNQQDQGWNNFLYVGNLIIFTLTLDQIKVSCTLKSWALDTLQPAVKGDFFSESAMCFSHCQNKYSKSLSWAWNLNELFTVMGGKFKFQIQDSNLEYLFWRFDKHIILSEKKLPLPATNLQDIQFLYFNIYNL